MAAPCLRFLGRRSLSLARCRDGAASAIHIGRTCIMSFEEDHKYAQNLELALARKRMYDFLAGIYLEAPTPVMVRALAQGDLLEALADVSDGAPEYEQLVRAVRGADVALLSEELCIAYTALFIGPGPRYVAPYQSVYTDEWTLEQTGATCAGAANAAMPGLLWGDSTVAVRQEYRKAGLDLADKETSIPDHVGLELQFMGQLCSMEAEAWNTGDKEQARQALFWQQSFLERFLLRWIDSFCSKVMERADHPFYKVMAAVTQAFVHTDFEDIAASLN